MKYLIPEQDHDDPDFKNKLKPFSEAQELMQQTLTMRLPDASTISQQIIL
jgi:hypothetical protein